MAEEIYASNFMHAKILIHTKYTIFDSYHNIKQYKQYNNIKILWFYVPIGIHTYLINFAISFSLYLSIYLSIYLYIYLSIYLSIYLHLHLHKQLLNFFHCQTIHAWYITYYEEPKNWEFEKYVGKYYIVHYCFNQYNNIFIFSRALATSINEAKGIALKHIDLR